MFLKALQTFLIHIITDFLQIVFVVQSHSHPFMDSQQKKSGKHC